MPPKRKPSQPDAARLTELLSRPLLRDEADELVKLARRLGVTLEWSHCDMFGRWQDGRKPRNGDEP